MLVPPQSNGADPSTNLQRANTAPLAPRLSKRFSMMPAPISPMVPMAVTSDRCLSGSTACGTVRPQIPSPTLQVQLNTKTKQKPRQKLPSSHRSQHLQPRASSQRSQKILLPTKICPRMLKWPHSEGGQLKGRTHRPCTANQPPNSDTAVPWDTTRR